MTPILHGSRTSWPSMLRIMLAGVIAASCTTSTLNGGEAVLKSGTRIEGTLVPVAGLTKGVVGKPKGPWRSFPLTMIETPMQRYFVPTRSIDDEKTTREFFVSTWETYEVPQKLNRRGRFALQSVGSVTDVTPFDEFGRRSVKVTTGDGPLGIVQGITEITSKYITITGLTQNWEFAIATTSVEPEILDPILNRLLDRNSPDDRLSIVRFYIESGRYIPAAQELASIRVDFPELKDRIEKLELSLRNETAKQLLLDLRRRKSNGQHELAYIAARQFPRADMRAEVLREVDTLLTDHAKSRGDVDTARVLLGELHASITDDETRTLLEPLRVEISNRLGFETVERLRSFLTLQSDPTLKDSEKLALAFSGWIVGSENAITGLDSAKHLVRARSLILEYLRTPNELQRATLLGELNEIEGLTLPIASELVKHLPMIRETPDLVIGDPMSITVPDPQTSRETNYQVVLPTEYDPARAYPLVVAIPASERSPEQSAFWWAGNKANPLQAQRRGYIVISPNLFPENQKYDFASASHQFIKDCIRDACLRFHVDSDRIFLAGHGEGGTAAFDLGMSHPELFAGVIPICGLSQMYTKWYWPNGDHTAWYIVGGELDRQSLERNARDVNHMMKSGQDIIYAEYIGRGYESYYEEIHKLFDWMDQHQRKALPKELEALVLRPADGDWYWVNIEGLQRYATDADIIKPQRGRAVRPIEIKATLQDGNADRTIIYVQPNLLQKATVMLSPELIDFDRRLKVQIGTRTAFFGFPPTDIGALLDDFGMRGDRQRLFWGKLTFP